MSFTVESEGGEYEHKLTQSEMPSHSHVLGANPNAHAFSWGRSGTNCVYLQNAIATAGNPPSNNAMTFQGKWNTTNIQGDDQSHNNIQPYIVVYMWKRTA